MLSLCQLLATLQALNDTARWWLTEGEKLPGKPGPRAVWGGQPNRRHPDTPLGGCQVWPVFVWANQLLFLTPCQLPSRSSPVTVPGDLPPGCLSIAKDKGRVLVGVRRPQAWARVSGRQQLCGLLLAGTPADPALPYSWSEGLGMSYLWELCSSFCNL